ncbi:MAG: hypothetical protein IIZ28_04340 [Erysipelotrichaceae bacterium]|nr:hypothetical protein [Erysipelotrichaceae bacterium]
MKINEKKLLDYLERHIGERMRSIDLLMESEVCEGKSKKEILDHIMRLDEEVHKIAEDNGYFLNSRHHDNEILGMPWVYDFYIEVRDVDKDIARIDSAFQYKMKLVLIEQEYGIYDEETGMLFGFRTSIPWQIKKIYDEVRDEVEHLEADGTIID